MLDGQAAWVTGGGSGIGRAIAVQLAAEGASVVVTGRRGEALQETVATIARAGGKATSFRCDVRDRTSVSKVVGEAGPLDLLVNNAGVFAGLGLFWEGDIDEWWLNFEVNVLGTLVCSRAVLPDMVERKSGRIVNIVSSSADGGGPMQAAYSASKTALVRLSDALDRQLADTGVHMFGLDPGLVYTPMVFETFDSEAGRRYSEGWEEYWEQYHVPPESAAQSVCFIASGRADSLSGLHLTAMDDLEALTAVRKTSAEKICAPSGSPGAATGLRIHNPASTLEAKSTERLEFNGKHDHFGTIRQRDR